MNDNIAESIKLNIEEASKILDKCYPSFESKIDLLREIDKDKNYPYNCAFKNEIKAAIALLAINARDKSTRRVQQGYLAPLVAVFMKNYDKAQLEEYFKNNNTFFNIYILTLIHFNDETSSEKEKEAHEYLDKPLRDSVKKLIA
ncbi:MAG: hypothetical protein HUJ42_03520 [Malacoplasma sp.]|nr:hypothetical protein [Malacoplasma sp.]